VLAGAVIVAPLTGTRLRIPWAVVTGPVSPKLIGGAQLSAASFKHSDVSPSILLVQLGRLGEGAVGLSVEPVLRLDIRLHDSSGKDIGLLSRLRDVLPGRYAFGLTGRGPNGHVLPAGRPAGHEIGGFQPQVTAFSPRIPSMQRRILDR
jgi:hypothetical protein